MQFKPRFAGYDAKTRNSFAQQAMMKTFGAEIIDLKPGHCVITAPIKPGVTQQHGFAHAALTFAIGDTAAGYAALSMMDEKAEVLTVEMKINLYAPAKGDLLIATGKVVKPGRRLIIVSAEVAARDNDQTRPIALLQGTMIPVE